MASVAGGHQCRTLASRKWGRAVFPARRSSYSSNSSPLDPRARTRVLDFTHQNRIRAAFGCKMIGSAFAEFKLNFSQFKYLSMGDVVRSDEISAGEQIWRIYCYPRGNNKSSKGEYLSLYLRLVSKAKKVRAIFEASVVGSDGRPSQVLANRCTKVYPPDGIRSRSRGWHEFAKRRDLESSRYIVNECVTFICGIIVLDCNSVPASDLREHLGCLLDRADTADVSFCVKGKTFHAHRAVLAASSPVFKAELFGTMAEATMPCITLHDIEPVVFKVMLRFMYTDDLPADSELGETPMDMLKYLFAAADRYALDRLKLVCAQRLLDIVSVDTVADSLACAEIYNCPELKSRCIDFLVAEKNFKKVVLTESFMQFGLRFPSIIAELRVRVGA